MKVYDIKHRQVVEVDPDFEVMDDFIKICNHRYTYIDALVECRDMWKQIAELKLTHKSYAMHRIGLYNTCACCHFVTERYYFPEDCGAHCPLRELWGACDLPVMCDNSATSPYLMWKNTRDPKFATRIANYADMLLKQISAYLEEQDETI